MQVAEAGSGAVAPREERLQREIAGLDALELATPLRESFARRAWRATWPKVAAIGLVILLWQLVVWSGWKSETILPSPFTALDAMLEMFADGSMWEAIATTMSRAVYGFVVAIVIGVIVGSLIARVPVLRAAFGSMITGLQTMPSIAWFPLAIVLFAFSETAILFVVVIGAAPAIANGLIHGADTIPPILLRAGRVLGARGFTAYRHVVLPATLPSFVGGLKQGWAFAWRSLMAGELLNVVRGEASLGFLLVRSRELTRYDEMMAVMIVILAIGVLVDALFFGTLERGIRRRWGLVDTATATR
jgi:NitT/TauT family transport system permease protein